MSGKTKPHRYKRNRLHDVNFSLPRNETLTQNLTYPPMPSSWQCTFVVETLTGPPPARHSPLARQKGGSKQCSWINRYIVNRRNEDILLKMFFVYFFSLLFYLPEGVHVYLLKTFREVSPVDYCLTQGSEESDLCPPLRHRMCVGIQLLYL